MTLQFPLISVSAFNYSSDLLQNPFFCYKWWYYSTNRSILYHLTWLIQAFIGFFFFFFLLMSSINSKWDLYTKTFFFLSCSLPIVLKNILTWFQLMQLWFFITVITFSLLIDWFLADVFPVSKLKSLHANLWNQHLSNHCTNIVT